MWRRVLLSGEGKEWEGRQESERLWAQQRNSEKAVRCHQLNPRELEMREGLERSSLRQQQLPLLQIRPI